MNLVLVDTTTGTRIKTVRGDATWPDGALMLGPKAGLAYKTWRVCAVSQQATGEGPIETVVAEAWDGADGWVQTIERSTPPKTPEQIQADYLSRIQARLDAFAQTRGYDGILSAATYEGDKNPKFAAEAAYCKQARSDTWTAGYSLLDQAQQTGAIPTWEEVEAQLPGLAWPE